MSKALPSRRRLDERLKRVFDVVVSIIVLVVGLPLFLLIALAIKLTSPGPVFYRGVRSGLHGKPFRVFKFRTMVVDAARLGGPSTGKDDPRVTPVGRFLRRFKLDELPNFINVLRGEMSVVGPRPEVEQYTRLYTGEERIILTVRPGITDLSSVRYFDLASHIGSENVDQNFETHVLPIKNRLRVQYVKEWSFANDLRIIGKTVLRLLGLMR